MHGVCRKTLPSLPVSHRAGPCADAKGILPKKRLMVAIQKPTKSRTFSRVVQLMEKIFVFIHRFIFTIVSQFFLPGSAAVASKVSSACGMVRALSPPPHLFFLFFRAPSFAVITEDASPSTCAQKHLRRPFPRHPRLYRLTPSPTHSLFHSATPKLSRCPLSLSLMHKVQTLRGVRVRACVVCALLCVLCVWETQLSSSPYFTVTLCKPVSAPQQCVAVGDHGFDSLQAPCIFNTTEWRKGWKGLWNS